MNKEHGKNYDSKNMCHCIRLLNTAIEIADNKIINVKRSPKEIEILMKIRRGTYELDDLLKDAEEKLSLVDEKFKNCNLPNEINQEFINNLLFDVRTKYYKKQNIIINV
jgi:hypothetical protein